MNEKSRILREAEYRTFRYGDDDRDRRQAERERYQNRRAKLAVRQALLDGRRF